MELHAVEKLPRSVRRSGHVLFKFGFALLINEESPNAAQETIDALHTLGAPWLYHFEWSHEHFVKAEGVGSVLVQNIIGVDHIPARFRHLLPIVAQNQALVHQFEEGFGGGDMTEIK